MCEYISNNYLCTSSTYLSPFLPLRTFFINNSPIKIIALTVPEPHSLAIEWKSLFQRQSNSAVFKPLFWHSLSPANCSSDLVTKSQAALQGSPPPTKSFQTFFPIPELPRRWRKELSAWAHTPAMTFLGGQTTGQKALSPPLFFLETKENFPGNPVLQTCIHRR